MVLNIPKVFNSEGNEFQVRTIIGDDHEPWFVATDVCKVLGLTDTNMSLSRLDEDEKLTQVIFGSGQNRTVWTISESGLYSLIMTSRKPSAKRFKKWVTLEVLPSIRKTGSYSVAPAPMSPLDLMQMQLDMMRQMDQRTLTLENKVKDLIDVISPDAEYFTIAHYAHSNDIKLKDSQKKSLGRRATKLSLEMGYEKRWIKKMDYNYGAYHVAVLDELFNLAT